MNKYPFIKELGNVTIFKFKIRLWNNFKIGYTFLNSSWHNYLHLGFISVEWTTNIFK
jgi:hypothetical protein